jgi:hypothetical protein
MSVRARSTSASIVEFGHSKIREVRIFARRLEARARSKTLARRMPRLCADLIAAARELRDLCRVLEVAGKDSITIKGAAESEGNT